LTRFGDTDVFPHLPELIFLRDCEADILKELEALDLDSYGPGSAVEALVARCDYINAHDNIIALGNSGTGKTHVALALGLAACQRGLSEFGCSAGFDAILVAFPSDRDIGGGSGGHGLLEIVGVGLFGRPSRSERPGPTHITASF
jgi:hypothetical protein